MLTHTIAVLNQKGGVGKSTIATNLAAAAHLAGLRTLVLDMDKQGSAFDWYAQRSDGSKLDGLTVVRADRALQPSKFREIVTGYDIVICDGPPRVGDITRSAAVAADVVVIPLRPGGFDWWAAHETIETIDAADSIRMELGKPPVRRVFLVNGAVHNRLTAELTEALAGAGLELAAVTVFNRTAFASAATHGESVLTVEPRGKAADEVRSLWKAVHQ